MNSTSTVPWEPGRATAPATRQQREAIESVASRFPDGEDLGATIVDELNESFADEVEPGKEPFTYEKDIEPWLGERGALVFTSFEDDEDDERLAFVVETTDADAAAAALGRIAEVTEDREQERQIEGATYYVTPGDGSAVGVVGEYGVGASTEEDLLAVADVINGKAESLADRDEFSYSVGDEDGSDALGYLMVDALPIAEQAIGADPSPEVTPQQVDRIATAIGFDLDAPLTFALTATADAVRFDQSVAVTDEEVVGEGSAELLASLPSDSWAASTCPACVEAFQAAVDLGIEQAAAEDGVSREEAQEAIRERFGVDTDELAAVIGNVALFVRGTGLPNLAGAVVAEVEDPEKVRRAMGAARRVIEAQSGVSVEEGSGLPGGAEGFVVESPEVPVAINVAAIDERLVIGLGEEATRDALEPTDTLADSDALEEAESQLDGDFEPSATIDLDKAVGLIESLASGDPDFAAAAPYLEPLASATGGAHLDEGRLITRTVIGFD